MCTHGSCAHCTDDKGILYPCIMRILIFPSKIWAKKCTFYTAKYGPLSLLPLKEFRAKGDGGSLRGPNGSLCPECSVCFLCKSPTHYYPNFMCRSKATGMNILLLKKNLLLPLRMEIRPFRDLFSVSHRWDVPWSQDSSLRSGSSERGKGLTHGRFKPNGGRACALNSEALIQRNGDHML